tara:strand:- start:1779 stop:3263 length:1485 start_codon:yes stop_codon:yes gene_type:complete
MSDPKVFANSVELKSCLILGNNKSKPFNATDGVLRFDYFENIEAPTVFGSLQIGEESMNSMISDIPLQGGEQVEIKLNTKVDEKEHTYNFVVYKIYSRYLTDRFQTYTLGLVSYEALANEMAMVGTIQKGLPSEIVLKLLKDNLKTKKKVMVDKAFNTIKFQPGKKTPFSIIETLKMKTICEQGNSVQIDSSKTYNLGGRAGAKLREKQVQTGGIGASNDGQYKKMTGTAGYLFWENKEGYNFRSMDKLYDTKSDLPTEKDTDPKVKNKPVATYRQVNTQLAEDPRFVISSVEFEKEIDLLDKLRHGAYSSVICYYNYSTGSYEEYAYSLDEQFKDMDHLGPQDGVPAAQKMFSEYPTRIMSVLLDHETWHDGEGVGSPEPKDGAKKTDNQLWDYQKFFTSQSIARFNSFNNQQLQIKVPGNPSLKVGDLIDVKIMNQTINKNKPGQEWDAEHSGKYLISKLNHAFVPKKPITETFLTLIRDVYGDEITKVEIG